MRRFAQINLVALAACVAMASSAQAQPSEERLTLKFNTPVMVPGATLPPGTYLFTESETAEDVVLIYNEDQTELLATALAVPAVREDVTEGETVVTIQRTSPGMAPALAKVFYPGKTRGHEFVYSEARARELADETRRIVLAHDAPEGSDLDALGRARLWKTEPGGARSEYRREGTAQAARSAEDARTEGRTAQRAAADRGAAEQHLNRISELLDRMLEPRTGAVGTTGQSAEGQVLVDRAQLEEIKAQLKELREELQRERNR